MTRTERRNEWKKIEATNESRKKGRETEKQTIVRQIKAKQRKAKQSKAKQS